MDAWLALQALLLGIVEGLTEFLPISSTGHQIVVADLLGFAGARAQAFNIIIQLGAVLAVIWEYRLRIIAIVIGVPRDRIAQRFTINLLVAVLPAAVIGVLFADLIHTWLFNPLTVACALVVGGVLMLWAEQRTHEVKVTNVEQMHWSHALKVGCAQCLALVPGTSRSAATIIGGLLFGSSAQGGHRVLVFSGDADHGRCSALLGLEIPRTVRERRSAAVRAWFLHCVRDRDADGACAAAFYRQSQLRGVRVVPDRLRSADPAQLASRRHRLVECRAMNQYAALWPLDPAVEFLNHGSFGSCPLAVLDKQAELRRRMERQPVDFLVRDLEGLLDKARAALAAFVGADVEDLVLVPNATAGVNSVLRSFQSSLVTSCWSPIMNTTLAATCSITWPGALGRRW